MTTPKTPQERKREVLEKFCQWVIKNHTFGCTSATTQVLADLKAIEREELKLGVAKSVCTCCEISYYKGRVLSGFTIAQHKKGSSENDDVSIDIPCSEIPNLIKIAQKVLAEENGGEG